MSQANLDFFPSARLAFFGGSAHRGSFGLLPWFDRHGFEGRYGDHATVVFHLEFDGGLASLTFLGSFGKRGLELVGHKRSCLFTVVVQQAKGGAAVHGHTRMMPSEFVDRAEFDEAGFSAAIEKLCAPAVGQPQATFTAKASRRTDPVQAASVVILGGGSGGLVAAHHLRRRLSTEHHIVLIDRSPHHLFASSLLWMMVGQRRADEIRRPLGRLGDKGIDFHQGEVEEIDVDRKLVSTTSARFSYDFLVVSLGARLAPETVAGFDEMALNLYDQPFQGTRLLDLVDPLERIASMSYPSVEVSAF